MRSIENSLCFGVYNDGAQVGFARVISDFATFAYIADVFILEPYRGRGLAKELMATDHGASGVAGAAALESRHSRRARALRAVRIHRAVENPARLMMEIADPEVYLRSARARNS